MRSLHSRIDAEPEAPFKEDDRIELIRMPNDPCPIPEGTRGTVKLCMWLPWASEWQVVVKWDIDRSLSLVIPPDEARKIDG